MSSFYYYDMNLIFLQFQPYSIANHETCNCSTGNFHICRFMEQLLHTGPDHPVKEQDDSTNFDCHTSRSGLYEFRYGKNLYDDNSSYRAYYCCISPLIKIYYCRCHTWRREGVNNLISFSIRADGLHICYVGHLFFSILKYEVRHIFYLGNIVAPMQYISKRMQQNLQNISSQISCRIMIILSKQENSTITMQCI